jgi:hypothetical protein
MVKFHITVVTAREKEILWRPLNRGLGGPQTWPGLLEEGTKFLLLLEIK